MKWLFSMLHVSVISPDKKVWEGEALAITIPTTTGHIQVLKNHVPLVSTLEAGEVSVKTEGGILAFAVSAGLLEVRPGNQVVVLANTAEAANEIDEARAEAARARAKDLLTQKTNTAEEYAMVMAMLQKEFVRLKVAMKHKRRS